MRYLVSFVLLAFLAAPVWAATEMAPVKFKDSINTGGFDGPISGAMAETVEKSKDLPDGARVLLTGNIVSRIAGEKDEFIFKDSTGEIPVEISIKKFQGKRVTPQDKVRISGKVDRGKKTANDIKIEVRMLELIK